MNAPGARGESQNATELSEVSWPPPYVPNYSVDIHSSLDDYSADAYRFYIASLKASSTFAPAFTSLGIHYLIASSPPDRARALKCFQKAFELDSRETYAAEQLATGFANEGAWSLVEVVARRTIQGNNVEVDLPGFEAEDDDPYSALTWAWKAVGAVELVRSPCHTAPLLHSFTAFCRPTKNIAPRSQPSKWSFGRNPSTTPLGYSLARRTKRQVASPRRSMRSLVRKS